VILAIFSVFLV